MARGSSTALLIRPMLRARQVQRTVTTSHIALRYRNALELLGTDKKRRRARGSTPFLPFIASPFHPLRLFPADIPLRRICRPAYAAYTLGIDNKSPTRVTVPRSAADGRCVQLVGECRQFRRVNSQRVNWRTARRRVHQALRQDNRVRVPTSRETIICRIKPLHELRCLQKLATRIRALRSRDIAAIGIHRHRGQNADDGSHDHQFDQSEARRCARSTPGRG